MMMVRSPGTQNVSVYIALPIREYYDAFMGFEAARFDEIPADFSCEIGREAEVQELREALNLGQRVLLQFPTSQVRKRGDVRLFESVQS